jgi:nitrogen fixation protein NifB
MSTNRCPAECKGTEAEYYRRVMGHPCFSEEAQHRFGRMHLPVAPKCNIKCNYCDRRYDCPNESRPGVTSQVLTPAEAIIKLREVIAKFPFIKVIGIAGPGEPLYNDETFETLRLVKEEFPDLKLCLSSNGLILPDKLDLLDELGVGTITVTINAVDPKIGKEIYSWVRYQGKYLRGLAAVELLLSRQLAGVRGAIERGIIVKVNTVLIPSINGENLPLLAKKMGELGVYLLNVIPLIPQSKFARLSQPGPDERKRVQDECSVYIKQMRHCRQCRADAVGLLGQDMSPTVYSKKA